MTKEQEQFAARWETVVGVPWIGDDEPFADALAANLDNAREVTKSAERLARSAPHN